MCQNHERGASKWLPRNSEPDPADPADPAETQHAVRNQPWVPHAGGQDYGSLQKLLKLLKSAMK